MIVAGETLVPCRTRARDEVGGSGQPIVDLGCGRLAGFDALVRRSHPSRGPVAPQEFVAFAEETGLIGGPAGGAAGC